MSADEQALRRFLERDTGFAIPDDRWRFLAPKFLSRLETRGFASVEDYIRYLTTDPLGRRELEEIYNLLTVRKTSFFRNLNTYTALEREVLPTLRARDPDRAISMWSAGCATGEEAYSMAMVAEAVLRDHPPGYLVLGTDIVREALSKAREGRYPTSALEPIPQRFRSGFHKTGERVWVRETVRERVEFEAQNLVHDTPPRPASGLWDAIFCRNVLIYFSLEQAYTIIRKIAQVLAPGGYLFLGHAEVFTEIEEEFEVVFACDTFFYRKRQRAKPPTGQFQKPAKPPTSQVYRRDMIPGRDAHQDSPTVAWRRPEDPEETRAFRPVELPVPPRDEDETRPAETRAGWRPHDLVFQAQRNLESGDAAAAIRLLRRVIDHSPQWAHPRVLLARAYARQGDPSAAQRQFALAVEIEPLNPEAHYRLGSLLLEQGATSEAEASLRKALYLNPDYVEARYLLAQTFHRQQRGSQACRELRNAMRALRTVHDTRRLRLERGATREEFQRKLEQDLGRWSDA